MIARLRLIADEISESDDLKIAIQALSRNVCFSGNSSRIFLGRFSGRSELTEKVSFGFDSEDDESRRYSLFIRSELPSAARTNPGIYIRKHNKSYFEKFLTQTGRRDNPIWRTTILMPVLPNYLVVVSVQEKILSSDKDVMNYYSAVLAIFQLFLKSKILFLEIEDRKAPKGNKKIKNSELTERQNLILKMIKSGSTNQEIASRMGYSESLIRQETIIIYRKLGISGRRDIQINSSNSNS